MPNYTAALVNTEKPKFNFRKLFFGSAASKSHYYSARHKTDDIYILWIENNNFGSMHSYPCVLDEQGDPMIYFTGRSNRTENRKMLQRWGLFAVPSTFKEDFDYNELDADRFYAEYNGYKNSALEKDLKDELEADADIQSTDEPDAEPPEEKNE